MVFPRSTTGTFLINPIFPNPEGLGKISKQKSPLGGVRCPKGIETFPNFPTLPDSPIHLIYLTQYG